MNNSMDTSAIKNFSVNEVDSHHHSKHRHRTADSIWKWRTKSMLVSMILMRVAGMTSALTPLQHMVNHCSKTVYVNNSLLFDLTDTLEPDRVLVGHVSCAVTLQAPQGARLYLHVLQLAISEHADMPDRLHLYEVSSTGSVTKRLTPNTGLYGVLERPFLIYNTAGIIVPDFKASGSLLRLDYQGKPTVIYRGFRVLITAFYSPKEDGICRGGTLYCPYAGTCVPISTRCDDMPNCGLNDDYDERGCQRQDVVSNLLDEYSLRTALIAGITGIVVFLSIAAVVFFVVTRYNRKRYRFGADQSVHYSARGGGSCRYRNEEDLTNLYAPPSYEDVMMPNDTNDLRKNVAHRSYDPPPTYSAAVAALIHKENHASDSSGDECGHNSLRDPLRHKQHAHYKRHHLPPSFEMSRLQGRPPTYADSEDERESVRMNGTWLSDTDEGEKVQARRRRKEGNGKGKKNTGSNKSSSLAKVHHTAPKKTRAVPGPGYLDTTNLGSDSTHSTHEGGEICSLARVSSSRASSSPERYKVQYSSRPAETSHFTPPTSQSDSLSDASPSHETSSSTSPARVGTEGIHTGTVPGETVSETESQQASVRGSKRNSRTESNSPGSSSLSSVHETVSASSPSSSSAAVVIPSPTKQYIPFCADGKIQCHLTMENDSNSKQRTSSSEVDNTQCSVTTEDGIPCAEDDVSKTDEGNKDKKRCPSKEEFADGASVTEMNAKGRIAKMHDSGMASTV